MSTFHLVDCSWQHHECMDAVEAGDTVIRLQRIFEQSDREYKTVFGYPDAVSDSESIDLLASTPIALTSFRQSPTTREMPQDSLEELGTDLPIISPPIYFFTHSSISGGNIVLHGVTDNALVNVGRKCTSNSVAGNQDGASTGDPLLHPPRLRVNITFEVGVGTFIGSGAVLREDISIGKAVLLVLNQGV